MRWYKRVTNGPNGDMGVLSEALEWFETEYETARQELKMSGRIETVAARLPGNAEYYYGIAMEIEHIFKWIEIQMDSEIAKWRRNYIEHYNRDISANTAEKFAQGQPEVKVWREILNEVGLVRSQFHGITKGLEYMHYQISNITKLRVAGIEDASI